MAQYVYKLYFKDSEGNAVNPQIHWLDDNGAPIMIGTANNMQPFITTPTNGYTDPSTERPNQKFKFTLSGYADKEYTATPGTNNITMQKSGSIAAAADTAKSNWWKIVLVIVLIILAVWAYKKYWKKG